MLIQVANKLKIRNYSLVAGAVLGNWGRIACDIMITSTQFSFCWCYVLYIISSCNSLLINLVDVNVGLWPIAGCLSLVIIPTCLIRNLEDLSCCFFIGVLCIITTGVLSIIVL